MAFAKKGFNRLRANVTMPGTDVHYQRIGSSLRKRSHHTVLPAQTVAYQLFNLSAIKGYSK